MAGIDGRSSFLQTLQQAQEKNAPVAVYADAGDFQGYEVGYVDFADRNEVILLCLTPKGEPDGRKAVRTDDITRIDFDSAYTRKLDLLYQYRASVFDKSFRAGPEGTSDTKALLEHAKKTNSVVHLVDGDDYGPSGFVEKVGEDFVELNRLGSNGEPDGTATVLISSVHKVHFARRQEQVLEFLYRYHHDLKRLLES